MSGVSEETHCPLHRHQEDGGPCRNCPDYDGPRLAISHREAELMREHVMGDLRGAKRDEFAVFFRTRLEPFVLAKWDAEEDAQQQGKASE